MRGDVFQPFERDVDRCGGYIYADPSKRSAVLANGRFSGVILSAVDFTGLRVVDVGCGDGTYSMVLARRSGAAEVLGIDPAARAIEAARRKYEGQEPRLRFEVNVAADLARQARRFDVAIYRGVIHHVGDPAAEIEIAFRLADRVFFLEPNGSNPVLKLLERFGSYHRAHEERSYVMGTYRRWIAAGGGRITRSFYFGLVPMFSPAWLAEIASRLEPVVERVPLLRALCCGQIGILAEVASPQSGA